METCQCYYSPLVHQAKAVANASSYASQRSPLTSHPSPLILNSPPETGASTPQGGGGG